MGKERGGSRVATTGNEGRHSEKESRGWMDAGVRTGGTTPPRSCTELQDGAHTLLLCSTAYTHNCTGEPALCALCWASCAPVGIHAPCGPTSVDSPRDPPLPLLLVIQMQKKRDPGWLRARVTPTPGHREAAECADDSAELAGRGHACVCASALIFLDLSSVGDTQSLL